jgi:IS1 family transposase
MNRLSIDERAQILAALVEGNSIRSVCRMLGREKRTVTRLLVDVGTAGYRYQDRTLRNLKCRRLECDEIWSFIGCKQKHVTKKMLEQRIVGDAWVWVAIDADTKLVPCWLVGTRDAGCATEFIADLERRLANRVQLTTDGHKVYLNAVIDAFADEIDYAQLVKYFGNAPESQKVQPGNLRRGQENHPPRRSGRDVHQHQLRGAPEPHDADVHAALHAAHQWILEESAEPRSGRGAALYVV